MRNYKHQQNKLQQATHPQNLRKIHRSRGFTLIEALVTVIVMSIGLLGVAALQNTSVKLTYDSYLRTQSALLASDLFDRMRANTDIDYAGLSYVSSSVGTTCSGASANCTALQMAAYDAANWVGRVEEIFGSETGQVTLDVATDAMATDFTVTFIWSPRTSSPTAPRSNNNITQEFSYVARVK